MDNTLILNELEMLNTCIKQHQIQKSTEWEGADVIICSTPNDSQQKWVEEQNIVISSQNTKPQKRLVVTKYSKELSWLFNELKQIFNERFDFVDKYDFYGLLTQSALDYINTNKENENLEALLSAVLLRAKEFVK